jgi:hypothetical protein
MTIRLVLCVVILSHAAVDLINLPANSWLSVPNTRMDAVAPSASQYPGIQGVEGVSAVMDDWCGAAFDTKRNRLMVWGGGHNGYYGNELYAFDVDSLKWFRITDPTPNPSLCSQTNPDGTPNGRHTYNGLAYIAHADRFFAIGGAPACPSGGCGMNKTWAFDFDALHWTDRLPSGTIPGTCCDDLCAYDPATKKVWFGDAGAWACGSGKWGLYSYDYDSNTWTKHTSHMFIGAMAVDTKRHVLLNVGHTSAYSSDYVTAYDLDNTSYTRQVWNTTGGDAFIRQNGIALEYDPVADRYVGWNGGAVYVLDPDTKAWAVNSPGGAPAKNMNNTYGRFRYVPKYNVYVNVNRTDANVYFYKLTAGAGTDAQAALPADAEIALTATPNPFRTAVKISRQNAVGSGQQTEIAIYNCRGKLVAKLPAANGLLPAEVTWDASGLPAGVYVAKLDLGNQTYTKRMFLQK